MSEIKRYPMGPGLADPAMLAFLANYQGTPIEGGGGGVSQAALDAVSARVTALESTVGTNEVTPGLVASLIRGNGLFRPFIQIFDTHTMNDSSWQCFLLCKYVLNLPISITVAPPSEQMAIDTYQWSTGAPPSDVAKPAGVYTLIVNPNNPETVTVTFPNGTLASGYTGSAYSSAQSVVIPQGRTLLLMYLGTNYYYWNLL